MAGLVSAAEFSADSVTTIGSMTITSKIYVKGDKQRMETSGGPMGSQIIILRPDKGLVWNLMPATKTYTERKGSKGAMTADPEAQLKAQGAKRVGTQRVNGYDCTKYEAPTGAGGGKATIWICPKLKQMMKAQAQTQRGSASQELKNIREQRQPDRLFELPKDYKKMTMPKPSSHAGGNGAALPK
jgi:hypothetical protein